MVPLFLYFSSNGTSHDENEVDMVRRIQQFQVQKGHLQEGHLCRFPVPRNRGGIDNRRTSRIAALHSGSVELPVEIHVHSCHSDNNLRLFQSLGSICSLHDTRECSSPLFHSTKALLLWLRRFMLFGLLSLSHCRSAGASHG